MKQISLSKGKFTQVDDEDYDFLMQWKWHAKPSTSTFYAVRTARINGHKKHFKMHRVILKISDPEILGDHEDRDGLNNQKYNLRIATKIQNNKNCGVKRKNKKYLGVFKRVIKTGIRFDAKITINYKSIHLATFMNEEDAAKCYDEAAKIHHGKFANLNFK